MGKLGITYFEACVGMSGVLFESLFILTHS
jgi:hypothetical protein